jgi:hypothetical protein
MAPRGGRGGSAQLGGGLSEFGGRVAGLLVGDPPGIRGQLAGVLVCDLGQRAQTNSDVCAGGRERLVQLVDLP